MQSGSSRFSLVCNVEHGAEADGWRRALGSGRSAAEVGERIEGRQDDRERSK